MNIVLVLALIAVLLAAIELVRSRAEDLAAWGVLLLAAALLYGRFAS